MFVALQYWRINILLLLFAHDYVCILSFFFYGPLAPEINDILSYLILSHRTRCDITAQAADIMD